MGGLRAAVFALQVSANDPVTLAQQVTSALYISIPGVVFGVVMEVVEGVVLAYPLAHILGRFGDGG